MGRHKSGFTRRGRLLVTIVSILALGAMLGVAASAVGLIGGGDDYPGPGDGQVVVAIKQGMAITQMGDTLAADGVVASSDAFRRAASANSVARYIHPGYYELKKHMKASDVVAALTDPKSAAQRQVVVREGARVADVVTEIVSKTEFTKAQVNAALANPVSLGLPAAANGSPEGWLFPATYPVTPDQTPAQLLGQMVSKATTEYAQLGVSDAAAKRGMTPTQLITLASILEYEGKKADDYPKIAQAIYNRLAANMPLQSDATVGYANNVSGRVTTTDAERANPSPYNTYVHPGLPPGPIGSPGEVTLRAAMNPTPGPWLYWVVVNLKTGDTVFSTTIDEHNAAVAQFQAYCAANKGC